MAYNARYENMGHYTMNKEEDHWFLPGPPEDAAPTDPPWSKADRRSVFNPQDWLRAEGEQGRGLANAAAAFARLDARITAGHRGTGFAKRLALSEVSALLWLQGDWVETEKITLYRLLRETSQQDARVLSSADWAVRRLLGAGMPDDLAAFLGRHKAEYDGLEDLGQHPVGVEFDGLAEDWQAARAALKVVHPITRAAALFTAWRAFGLSEPGATLEAGVASAEIGAAEARSLSFLPVASDGGIGQGGEVEDRLARWYNAVANACLKAEMQIDQLENWQEKAAKAIIPMSGKTPPLLVGALLEGPAVSAGMAAEICNCDKATARRNLARFTKLGLIREITGQGRYRVWTVRG